MIGREEGSCRMIGEVGGELQNDRRGGGAGMENDRREKRSSGAAG